MRLTSLVTAAALAALLTVSTVADLPWKDTLNRELPRLGHRNWIVIADSAYPWQTAPGIETVATDADQVAVVQAVLEALAKTSHVRPTIFTDSELKFVPEAHAPGIDKYRQQLDRVLAGRPVQSLPHEQIIGKLDEAGKTFHVLLLKTRLTLPYTSVFVQLDCGYWSPEAEKALRDAIEAATPTKAGH